MLCMQQRESVCKLLTIPYLQLAFLKGAFQRGNRQTLQAKNNLQRGLKLFPEAVSLIDVIFLELSCTSLALDIMRRVQFSS